MTQPAVEQDTADDSIANSDVPGSPSIDREEAAKRLGIEEDLEEERTITLDDIFHILQNERRRQVLHHLHGVDGTVMMRDVAEAIAAWENDTTVENLHSDQRQRVYIALYQSHLPKLDDLGVIEYNQSRGYIETTPLLDEVIQYLQPTTEETEDQTIEASELVLSFAPAAVVSGALLVGTAVLGWVALPGLALGALVGAMFVITAGVLALT